MKLSNITLTLVLLLVVQSGFSQADSVNTAVQEQNKTVAETPKEGLLKIVELYKNQDASTLVSKRYSELPKANNEKQKSGVTKMMTKKLANEEYRNQMVELMEKASKSEPEIVQNKNHREMETGKMAKFKITEGKFLKLYEMTSGIWGFHI